MIVFTAKRMHPQVEKLLARPRIEQHTDEWYNARQFRLTASDVGSVLGCNPYCSKKTVFKRKTFQSKPFAGNFACRHGQKYEPLARKAYEYVTGIKCLKDDIGLVTHKDFSEFGASPDGVAIDHPIILEIKCPLSRKIIPGEIPEMYMCQVQFQLEICDIDICHFIQFRPGSLTQRGIVDITEVHRDPAWWEANYLELHQTWRQIVEFWAQPGAYDPRPDGSQPRKTPPFHDGPSDSEKRETKFAIETDEEFIPKYYDVTMQMHKSIKTKCD